MSSIPAKMRAVLAGKVDGKPTPVVEIIDTPQPGPHEILIKVAATGLNRGDLMQVMGLYPPPPGAPATLGLEASGTVVAVGPNVSLHKVGDPVCVLVAGGGYAEYCVAHEGSALPVPKGVSLVDAAALPEAHFTVWTNVVDRARLRAGETLLIHGGSSGIGTAAIQLFAARGHRVRLGGNLFSDAMGRAGTYEGSYEGMMDHNITTIVRALGGEAPAAGLNGRLRIA